MTNPISWVKCEWTILKVWWNCQGPHVKTIVTLGMLFTTLPTFAILTVKFPAILFVLGIVIIVAWLYGLIYFGFE